MTNRIATLRGSTGVAVQVNRTNLVTFMLRAWQAFDFHHVLVTGSCDNREMDTLSCAVSQARAQPLEEFPDQTPVIGDLDRPAVGGVQFFHGIDSHP